MKNRAVRKNVPKTCKECTHFSGGEEKYLKIGISFCSITNEQTWHFVNPVDRSVPRPTQCPYNPS